MTLTEPELENVAKAIRLAHFDGAAEDVAEVGGPLEASGTAGGA